MKQLIRNFSSQLREGIKIGKSAEFNKWEHPVTNVLISGMGGSGIVGNIVVQTIEDTASVPVLLNKNYYIPDFINENTLVIICSYSGNTEETLNCLNQSIKKNAKIVCITSGGKVEEIAKSRKLDLILIPGGMPPRTCLGYSLIQHFFVLSYFGVFDFNFVDQFYCAAQLIEEEEENILSEAKSIAQKLLNKTPVIYSAANIEAVVIRFRQQLNENSKVLCWHHVFPELNHNELVGWRDNQEKLIVILLRNQNDFQRTKQRIEISKKIIQDYVPDILEIFSKGNSTIETAIYLVYLTDWVSYFLAEEKGIDSIEIDVLNYLKSQMSKTAIN